MWLLFLRFYDRGKITTMHLRCSNQKEVKHVLEMAKERGFTATSTLEEYASFYSVRTIHDKVTPSYHLYTTATFRDKWVKSLVDIT
ncbi:MAG: hypothetical protein ACPGWR_23440 [Ardenticatenaceae bacterium]